MKLLSLFFFVAISLQVHADPLIVDLGPILTNAKLDNKTKARQLFDKVVMFHSLRNMPVTQPLMEEVLRLDPELKEAQVMAAFTRPIWSLRGLYKRGESLIKKYPRHQRNLFQVSDENFLEFLNENTGASAINNDADFQVFLNEVHLQANKSRQVLKANRELDVQLTQYLDYGYEKYKCDVERNGNILIVANEKHCVQENVRLGPANIASMLYYVIGVDAMIIFYNSYQSKGVLALDRLVKDKSLNATEEMQYEFLKSIPEFGLLKTTHQLRQLLTLGADAIPVLKYMASAYASICSFGLLTQQVDSLEPKTNSQDYEYNYRLNADYAGASNTLILGCAATSDLSLGGESAGFGGILHWVGLIASGKAGIHIAGENQYQTTVNPTAPIAKPVEDLKILLPTQFNSCHKAMNVGEETLGGIFPNGDATKVFVLSNRLDRPCN